jgi:hypothetical protein
LAELIANTPGYRVIARKRVTMTVAGMASQTGHSKLIDADPIALESIERRKWIEHQDRAFVRQLRAAILSGLETPAGVLGHQRHGPSLQQRKAERRASRGAEIGNRANGPEL